MITLLGVNAITQYTVVPFSPTDLSDLSGWWKNNTDITTTAASTVSQWNDQTTNARHLIQTTDAARPLLASGGKITCDGVNDYLDAGFTFAQPYTLYLLCNPLVHGNEKAIHGGYQGAAFSGLATMKTASPRYDIYAGVSDVTNNDMTIGSYNVLAHVFNGASSSARVNNNTKVTGSAGTQSPNGLTLACLGSGTQHGNVEYMEVVIYNVAHTDSEQNQVVSYLMSLGGI